jgi:hypothetical protein
MKNKVQYVRTFLGTKLGRVTAMLALMATVLVSGGSTANAAPPTPPADAQSATIDSWLDFSFDSVTYLYNSTIARVIVLVVLAVGVAFMVRKAKGALSGRA